MRSTFVYERGSGLVMLLVVLLIAAMLRSGQFVSGDDPYFGGEFFRFTRNLDGEFRAILFQFALGGATLVAGGLLYLTFRP